MDDSMFLVGKSREEIKAFFENYFSADLPPEVLRTRIFYFNRWWCFQVVKGLLMSKNAAKPIGKK